MTSLFKDKTSYEIIEGKHGYLFCVDKETRKMQPALANEVLRQTLKLLMNDPMPVKAKNIALHLEALGFTAGDLPHHVPWHIVDEMRLAAQAKEEQERIDAEDLACVPAVADALEGAEIEEGEIDTEDETEVEEPPVYGHKKSQARITQVHVRQTIMAHLIQDYPVMIIAKGNGFTLARNEADVDRYIKQRTSRIMMQVHAVNSLKQKKNLFFRKDEGVLKRLKARHAFKHLTKTTQKSFKNMLKVENGQLGPAIEDVMDRIRIKSISKENAKAGTGAENGKG